MSFEARSVQISFRSFTDPSFHLLVGDQAIVCDVLLGFANRGKEGDLFGNVTKVRIRRKAVDRFENLFLDAQVLQI